MEKEENRSNTNIITLIDEELMHKTFGIKEKNRVYFDRKGVYIIPIKDDHVGIVETPKGYFLIGGGMDSGETESQCIIRECIEETGYHVEIDQRICSAEMYCEHPSIGFFHPTQIYYSGRLTQKIQKPTEADHIFRWVNIESVKKQMFLEMQRWAIMQVWEKEHLK